MTPTLPNILTGQMIALVTPLPPEAGADYLAGRVGIMAMLSSLAAQEAERGAAAAAWENEAIAALLESAGAPAPAVEPDLSLAGLGALNADLRRRLIAAHEAAETAADADLQIRILDLYRQMAAARRLDLAGG
jgi:hypothetical protein